VIRGQVGGKSPSNRYSVVKLGMESVVVAGVGWIASMEDGSDHAFAGINGDSCPLTEQMYLSTLGFEVSQGASEGTSIVRITQAAGVVPVLLGLG
jgi:hypothetical protein